MTAEWLKRCASKCCIFWGTRQDEGQDWISERKEESSLVGNEWMDVDDKPAPNRENGIGGS